MKELAIKARHVTKKFGHFTAIDNIDLSVPTGSIYGFLGPNGCGKSTIIRTLTGLLTPNAGEIEVFGYQIPQQADELRNLIGYMTQKFSLYDDLTVKENLSFIGKIYGIPPNKLKTRIETQLQTYDLDKLQHQLTQGMSGGQKQRLSLACATMHSPKLLFLDEPTSAVDPENRRDFWEKLFDLSEAGTTILVTTHYMDEAERCHRLAIMESGVIRADGTPDELMFQMGVHIIEIKADNLRELKQRLIHQPAIKSAAQLGVRLRVLIHKNIDDPKSWLLHNYPELKNAELTLARPSLEDVFVNVTGEGRQ